MKGAFIALYGVNNIGKSTQAKLLVERLQREGFDAVLLKYPIYDLEPTGPELNRILRGGEVQKISELELQELYCLNRRDFEPQLQQMIMDGKVVIAEDYIGTGMAWGMAKGLSLDEVLELNKGLLVEDLSILIEGKRFTEAQEKQHIHEQNNGLITRVTGILHDFSGKLGWGKVDTTSIEETHEKIWKLVKAFLDTRKV